MIKNNGAFKCGLLIVGLMLFSALSCSFICEITRTDPIRYNEFVGGVTYNLNWPLLTVNLTGTYTSDLFPVVSAYVSGSDVVFMARYYHCQKDPHLIWDLSKMGISRNKLSRLRYFWADSKKDRKQIFQSRSRY